MQKRIVITGASGFLGYHLVHEALKDYEVFALGNSRPVNIAGAKQFACDLNDYIATGNLLEDIEPDFVVHAAAMANANQCELTPEVSERINIAATANLSGICCDLGIPFSFTSTDLVFDGKMGNYKEDTATNPLNIYGKQKAEAECVVLNIYPHATIFRLPMMFGYKEASSVNFMQQMVATLQAGDTISLFTDEFRSVCGATSISKGILQLGLHSSGIIHLAGPSKLSRYEFGMLAAEVFGLDKNLINACKQADVPMPAPRPADVSLNIEKAVSLGFSPMPLKEELSLIANQTGYSK